MQTHLAGGLFISSPFLPLSLHSFSVTPHRHHHPHHHPRPLSSRLSAFSPAPLLFGAPYSHATVTHHSPPLTYTTVAIHVVIQPTAATKPTTHDASVWAVTATCTWETNCTGPLRTGKKPRCARSLACWATGAAVVVVAGVGLGGGRGATPRLLTLKRPSASRPSRRCGIFSSRVS